MGPAVTSSRHGLFIRMLAPALVALPIIVWLSIEIALEVYFLFDFAGVREAPLQTLCRLANLACAVLLAVLYCVRAPVVGRASSAGPRFLAVAAFCSPLVLLVVPRAALSPTAAVVSSLVFLLGTLATAIGIVWLGRSFSILPQARALVTNGPYRFVRHPIYLAEIVTVWGGAWNFQQPWSFAVASVVTVLQLYRLRVEEKILRAAFPTYELYKKTTARLIPGIY